MNDDILEQHLRKLPAPELPVTWQVEILSTALREARKPSPTRQIWPPLLVVLRNLFARNPFTASALTALWMLIFLLHASTPVDPASRMLIAKFDPNRPIYLPALSEKILLALREQDDDQPPLRP